MLKEHVAGEGHPWLECQGSPYYQHTALYPLTELLARRLLHVEPEATAAQKVQHLEGVLGTAGPVASGDRAAVGSPPVPPVACHLCPRTCRPSSSGSRRCTRSWDLLRLAAEQPLLLVMEDLHWVDPSTLEWLSLLVDQGPTARILALCTCRPDFRPPWTGRSHLTQMTLAACPSARPQN